MGQKTHPIGFRIAVTEQWRSRWYAGKKEFAKFLLEDQRIRRFIKKEWAFAAIPKVEIERTGELITVFLHTARPGILMLSWLGALPMLWRLYEGPGTLRGVTAEDTYAFWLATVFAVSLPSAANSTS